MKKDHNSIWNRKDEGITHNKDDTISKNISSENIPKKRRISKLAVILISIAIVLIIIFLIIFKLNFLIGEELRITLTPEYSEINTTGSSIAPFTVDTKLYNKFVCDATCNYSLTDISHNVILDNGSFNSKAYKNKPYEFDIPLDYLGYGTNTYIYKIDCINIRTAVCPTDNGIIIRKSLLVVQYSPSVEQMNAAESSENSYAIITNNVINASRLILNSENILNNVDLPFDKSRFNVMTSELLTLKNEIQNVISVWVHNDYSTVKTLIENNNLENSSLSLFSEAISYNDYLISTINDHNTLLSFLSYEQATLQSYKEILSLNLLGLDAESRVSIINSIVEGNSYVQSINSNRFNYTILYGNVSRLHELNLGLNDVLVNSTKSRLAQIYPALYIYSNMICALDIIDKSMVNSSNEANSINSFSNDSIFCGYNYALDSNINPNINISNIVDAATQLNDVCSQSYAMLGRIEQYSQNSDETAGTLSNQNSSNDDQNGTNSSTQDSNTSLQNALPKHDSINTLLLQYKLLIDYESVNEQTDTVTNYRTYVANTLADIYNITDPEVLIMGYNFNSSSINSSYFNSSSYTFNLNNLILMDIENINASCYNSHSISEVNSLPEINPITAKYYSVPLFNISSISNPDTLSDSDSIIYSEGLLTNLPQPVAQCCMYGKCQSCDKIPSKNPLIMLHGHSFNVNIDAYQSIEIFNGFEEAFIKDKEYFPTGILINNENSTAGILGHYYLPLMNRPTYYIESYNDLLGLIVSQSKTDNIDTYALRLKEYIDYTMYITGSDKVDIVAHSMGGLVLRRYMQIFGTASIGKVVLIATPNQGVSDRIYNLCKIFGSSNECENMRTNDIFIKKLNDLSTSQTVNDMYLVVGRGCDTDGEDGDGIVTVNNSMILGLPSNHIFYVDGKCSGTDVLHNDLLDTEKYPEVYEYVKSILG